MRVCTALSLLFIAGPALLTAQVCYNGRPKPACTAYVITNFGAYLLLGPDDWGDGPWREVADWGAMVNVSQKDAEVEAEGIAEQSRRHWLPD